MPMPAIMEITEEEAWGVDSAEGSIPRRPGDKTAASYLNFLIVNGGIVLPTFDDPNDAVAREIIAGVFPEREVVTVAGREIVLGGGNVHCITQQQPRGWTAAPAAPRTGAPGLITWSVVRRPRRAPCPTARSRSRAGSLGARRRPWRSRSRRGSAASP